jgi:hypothetical protein
MSVGDVLDRAIKMLTARLLTFYVINLIVHAPSFLLQLAFPALGGGEIELNEQGQIPPEQVLRVLAGVYGILFLSFILQQFGTAATLRVISQEFAGRHVGIGDALGFAFRRFGSLLWASLLAGLLVLVGYCCCWIVFCAPAFLFLVWFVFVSQVVVVEHDRGVGALSRSMRLTSGYRWRIFGVGALIGILYFVNMFVDFTLASALPSSTAVRTEKAITMVPNYRNYIINLSIGYVGQILVQTYAAICWTLLYFDIRIRKEGLDLELAAQQQSGEMGVNEKPDLYITDLE